MRAEDGLIGGLWKPGPRLGALWRTGLDLIFPPQALDGGPRPMSPGLSPEIWSRIRFIDGPVCDGCGAPFEYDQGPGARCAPCQTRPMAFTSARAACVYEDGSRDPILKLKHGDRLDLAPLLARWISRSARELIAEADAIVPVPLHPWRLIRRRYNQAAEIARPLALMTGRRYLPDVLVRRKPTPSQAGKSGVGRRRNVSGAFAVPERRISFIEGRRILLVDDVMTTGATLEACARVLKAAGAARVDVAVVARVQDGGGLTI